MVFQNYALFPSMSVWENIAFGLRVRKEKPAESDRLVREIAGAWSSPTSSCAKNVAELSGGQQQRVAVARALVLRPKILLLDEPLSNLDAKLRHQFRQQLKDLQSEFGITTVYVTHDQDEALAMSDRVAVFNKGVVEQVGTPQAIYDEAATEFVCNFIGDSSPLTPAISSLKSTGSPRGPQPATPTPTCAWKRPPWTPARHGRHRRSGQGTVISKTYHGLHSRYVVRCHGSRRPAPGQGRRRHRTPRRAPKQRCMSSRATFSSTTRKPASRWAPGLQEAARP